MRLLAVVVRMTGASVPGRGRRSGPLVSAHQCFDAPELLLLLLPDESWWGTMDLRL